MGPKICVCSLWLLFFFLNWARNIICLLGILSYAIKSNELLDNELLGGSNELLDNFTLSMLNELKGLKILGSI
jgi:hypothetical protein